MTDNTSLLFSLPKHVGIIMDGNGRWAESRGKIRLSGHKAGVNAVKEAITYAAEKGIERLTLFAFSSENWKRPKEEVSGLMELFTWALSNEVQSVHKNNIRLRVIGNTEKLSRSLQDKIKDAYELTAANTGLILNIAVNYGGRWDIVQAVKKIIAQKGTSLELDDITEELITENLNECADVDLLIRTGGEERISNFLLWQLAYSEIYVTDVLWPDFTKSDFEEAINSFMKRERRFGLTGEQIRKSDN